MNKIYDDVLEAIRYFEPNSPLLNMKEKKLGYLKRDLSFQLMEMPNGKMAALPKNYCLTFYRGENDDYDSCQPSIFRDNPTKEEILINRLKIIEFSLILKKHPKVKFAEKDGLDIHFDALAQHYELKTDLLDLTSDIVVAAFFATHKYNKKEKRYIPISEGVGSIRCYREVRLLTGDLEDMCLIGLQPFKRPGKQCAFGINLKQNEDFSTMSNKVIFNQKIEYSRRINELFCNRNYNKLIPLEDDINDIAEKVINTNKISQKAIAIYSKENNIKTDKIDMIVRNEGYDIVEELIYKLSRQRKRAIKRVIKNNPYGDVKISARLSYIPD